MSSNAYPSTYPQQSHQSPQAGPPGGSINPALLATFQHGQAHSKFPPYSGGSVNPAQLLNGMGGINHAAQQQLQGVISPAQVLQQQQQQQQQHQQQHQQQQHQHQQQQQQHQHQQQQHQQQQQQHHMMNGGMGMMQGGMNNFFGVGAGSANNMNLGLGTGNAGMGMGGINPAALSGSSHAHNTNLNTGMMGLSANSSGINPSMMLNSMNANMGGGNFSQMNMNPMNANQMNAMSANNINPLAALAAVGMTREQFVSLAPQDRQLVWQKALMVYQQQQQNQGAGYMGPGSGVGNQVQNREQFQHQQNQEVLGLMGRAIGPGHAGGTALNTATSAGAALSNLYDRPSSASSSHSQFPRIDGLPGGALANQTVQQHQMMPPPPPRPSTAQSQGHSRPNTALAHHSPTPSMHSSLPLPRPLSRSQQQPIPRPPSRAQQFQAAQQANQRPPSRAQHHQQIPNTAGAMNGFASKQPHSQVHPQQAQGFPGTSNSNNLQSPVQQQFPGALSQQSPLGQHFGSQQSQSAIHTFAGQGSPSPTATVPGSPLRGAKRKLGVEGSPRLGAGFQGGIAMGPPSALPKTMSEGLTQVGQIAGMGTMSMNNMNQHTNVNGSILLGQSPRPDSASGGVPAGHQTLIDVSMSPGLDTSSRGSDLNMNLSVGLDAMSSGGRGPQTPQSHRPTSSHSRQSSIPPQFPTVTPQNALPSVPLVQQHMRQGSMPPSVGLLNNVPVKNETRSSVPPAPAVPAASGTAPPAASGAPAAPTSAPVATTKSQGPPLPAGVNPAVTHVTLVPLADSTTNIPDLTDGEIKDIQGWMKTDKEYDTVWRKMKERMEEEEKEIFGPRNLPWWEKGSLAVNANRYRRGRENFDIRYPRKPKENGQRRKGVRREGIKLPLRLNPEDVNRPEQLVPIRLEFDVEHHKMRETFVWNLNDPVVTPEHFAQTLVEDYNLAPTYHAIITKSIQDQLSDFKAHTVNYDGDEDDAGDLAGSSLEDFIMKGRLDDEGKTWWTTWRKRLRTECFEPVSPAVGKTRKRRKAVDPKAIPSKDQKDKPLTIDEFDIDEQALHEEMRILIKLDIVVGFMKLDDQFEWDLDNLSASPEEFAEIYAQDLGLGGEFKTAIAHSIREQVHAYQKSLFLVGHPSDGSAVQDEELRLSFLPTLTSGARSVDQIQSFTPLLNYLSDGEIERSEREREKDMTKRRKRNTRGRRGIALPDREPIRTYRTPAIGFPELDPATLALAATAAAPSRRAAAAAASLTIANMVASENGVPFMPQPLPSVPQQMPPPIPKEKKVKGFFKAPSYPTSILRPRAQVVAPTPSTAADVSKLPAPLEDDPPPIIPALPDNKIAKVITAKRAKELEREAKEREYVDGQHPNYIDGVWHCSNCGCPESIAIGRRKGPLGDKSQCGTCGKYWHRHRRPRPVEYTPDPDFHSGLRREAELSKSASKKKGGAAALRAQNNLTPAEVSEPQTPSRSNDVENASRAQSPPLEDDRAISPVSTASSTSEPPLSQKVRVNGASHTKPSTPTPAAFATPNPPIQDSPLSRTNPQPAGTPPSSPTKAWPPQWLTTALQAMRVKYPKDRFELSTKKGTGSNNPEWRVRCLDCPGKLYTPGPGETLSNYEVHLKNRQHRQRVTERLNGGASSNTS